jgi:hypothetical protein
VCRRQHTCMHPGRTANVRKIIRPPKGDVFHRQQIFMTKNEHMQRMTKMKTISAVPLRSSRPVQRAHPAPKPDALPNDGQKNQPLCHCTTVKRRGRKFAKVARIALGKSALLQYQNDQEGIILPYLKRNYSCKGKSNLDKTRFARNASHQSPGTQPAISCRRRASVKQT